MPRKRNKTRKHNTRRLHYGLTQEDYNKIMIYQAGCCAVCDEQCYDLKLDHDGRRSNMFRGLVCMDCNVGVIAAADVIVNDPAFPKALKYVQVPPANILGIAAKAVPSLRYEYQSLLHKSKAKMRQK